ncbi:hypothetical protein VTN96DRAFT_3022 [Rasamsonia emersonii]
METRPERNLLDSDVESDPESSLASGPQHRPGLCLGTTLEPAFAFSKKESRHGVQAWRVPLNSNQRASMTRSFPSAGIPDPGMRRATYHIVVICSLPTPPKLLRTAGS